MKQTREQGGDANETLPLAGSLRCRAGLRYSDCGDLSYRVPSVPCGVSADRLRLRLYAQVEKGGPPMKIVVIKSPKFLGGILKRIFKMKE